MYFHGETTKNLWNPVRRALPETPVAATKSGRIAVIYGRSSINSIVDEIRRKSTTDGRPLSDADCPPEYPYSRETLKTSDSLKAVSEVFSCATHGSVIALATNRSTKDHSSPAAPATDPSTLTRVTPESERTKPKPIDGIISLGINTESQLLAWSHVTQNSAPGGIKQRRSGCQANSVGLAPGTRSLKIKCESVFTTRPSRDVSAALGPN